MCLLEIRVEENNYSTVMVTTVEVVVLGLLASVPFTVNV
jgi:hypothetical protein